jgi:hypothetical protein
MKARAKDRKKIVWGRFFKKQKSKSVSLAFLASEQRRSYLGIALAHKDLAFHSISLSPLATVSRDECLTLNDILGVKTLSGCHNLKHSLPSRDDAFTDGSETPFQADENKHRSSWLMPQLARRMTKNSPYHVSNWRLDVTIDESECAKLRALLTEKMGSPIEAEVQLPAACKRA